MTRRELSTSRLPLTLEKVRDRVAAIFEARHDDEKAHSLEDDLYRDVLMAVARGQYRGCKAEDLAFEALKTQGLSFERWCA